MEQQDLMNKKLGNKETPKLEAKDVEVQGVRVDEVSLLPNFLFIKSCCSIFYIPP